MSGDRDVAPVLRCGWSRVPNGAYRAAIRSVIGQMTATTSATAATAHAARTAARWLRHNPASRDITARRYGLLTASCSPIRRFSPLEAGLRTRCSPPRSLCVGRVAG
jgi:hypothetical protein